MASGSSRQHICTKASSNSAIQQIDNCGFSRSKIRKPYFLRILAEGCWNVGGTRPLTSSTSRRRSWAQPEVNDSSCTSWPRCKRTLGEFRRQAVSPPIYVFIFTNYIFSAGDLYAVARISGPTPRETLTPFHLEAVCPGVEHQRSRREAPAARPRRQGRQPQPSES